MVLIMIMSILYYININIDNNIQTIRLQMMINYELRIFIIFVRYWQLVKIPLFAFDL